MGDGVGAWVVPDVAVVAEEFGALSGTLVLGCIGLVLQEAGGEFLRLGNRVGYTPNVNDTTRPASGTCVAQSRSALATQQPHMLFN